MQTKTVQFEPRLGQLISAERFYGSVVVVDTAATAQELGPMWPSLTFIPADDALLWLRRAENVENMPPLPVFVDSSVPEDWFESRGGYRLVERMNGRWHAAFKVFQRHAGSGVYPAAVTAQQAQLAYQKAKEQKMERFLLWGYSLMVIVALCTLVALGLAEYGP